MFSGIRYDILQILADYLAKDWIAMTCSQTKIRDVIQYRPFVT